MAIRVQTQQGTTADANAYASVAAMRSFYADRGVDITFRQDSELEAALIKATDFIDARYVFVGTRLNSTQGTACPRYLPQYDTTATYLRDASTLEPAYLLRNAQWNAVVRSCIELAYRALTSTTGLLPDPVRDASGQRVTKKSVKAGPVETSKEYSDRPQRPDDLVPSYPSVDLLLRANGLLARMSVGVICRG